MNAEDLTSLLRDDEIASRAKYGRSQLDELATNARASPEVASQLAGLLPEVIGRGKLLPRSFWIALKHLIAAGRLTSPAAREDLEGSLKRWELRDPASYPTAVSIEALLGSASPPVSVLIVESVLTASPVEAFDQYTRFTNPQRWDSLLLRLPELGLSSSKLALIAQRYAQLCTSADRPFSSMLSRFLDALPNAKREFVDSKLTRALPSWQDERTHADNRALWPTTHDDWILTPALFLAELKNEQSARQKRSVEVIQELIPEMAA